MVTESDLIPTKDEMKKPYLKVAMTVRRKDVPKVRVSLDCGCVKAGFSLVSFSNSAYRDLSPFISSEAHSFAT